MRRIETNFHEAVIRAWYQMVSSGRFAYQMRRNCEKAMYDQKHMNANRNLPTSCRCSAVMTVSSSRARSIAGTSTDISAMKPMNEPAKKYTPNIVEYQRG